MDINTAPMAIMIKNYARKFGVSLRMQGSVAYTNGQLITIPRLDMNNKIIARLAYGYLAHESAHVRYTDFSVLKRPQIKNNLFLFSLFNILEDARIESLISLEYVGVFENLELLSNYYEKEWENFINNSNNISTLNLLLAFIQCYAQSYFQRFNGSRHKASVLYFLLRKRVSVTKLNQIANFVKACKNAKTSVEVYTFCLKIYRLVKGEEFFKQHQDKTNTTNLEDSENYRNILDESQKNFNKVKDKTSEKFLKEFTEFRISTNDDSENITPSKNGAVILQSVSNSKSSSSRDDFGLVETPRSSKGRDNFIETVNGTYALRATIYRKLYSYVEKLKDLSEQGRRLDIVKAQRLPLGETNIFKSKEYDYDYSTCVQICVDVSASMSSKDEGINSRCEDACISALSIAMALENIEGFKTAVHYFPGEHSESEIALDFNEKASKRAPYFDQRPRGSTPMAQCLYSAIQKVYEARCARSIIICITDGLPDSVKNTNEVFEIAKNNNIEIYGISIRSEMILKLFEHASIVENARDLNKAFLQLFKKLFDVSKIMTY